MFYEGKSPDIIGLIKDLWSPTVVAVVSYFISRLNLNIKKVELQAHAELRASELYFESYQKEIEKLNENTYVGIRKMSEFSNDLKNIHDPTIRIEKTRRILEHLKNEFEINRSFHDDLLEEAEKELNSKKVRDRIKEIKDIMTKDITTLKDDECEDRFKGYSRAASLLLSLEYDLKDKKRNAAFAKYIQ